VFFVGKELEESNGNGPGFAGFIANTWSNKSGGPALGVMRNKRSALSIAVGGAIPRGATKIKYPNAWGILFCPELVEGLVTRGCF
jgi:hypothetical protein